MSENCDFCMNHEPGDTLYELSEWDGGIGFDYIRNIKYCPLCGKKLLEWKEKKEKKDERQQDAVWMDLPGLW